MIAPFVIDEKLQDLPFQRGRSGVTNLNYLSDPARYINDLKAFRDVVPFTNMALLVDQMLLEAIPSLKQKAGSEARDLGIAVTLVPVGSSIRQSLDGLPVDIEAVLVTPLLRLPVQGI